MKKYLLLVAITAITTFTILPISASAYTLYIGTITPNAVTPAGTTISFQLSTDFGSPAYTLSDNFPGSTLSNSNVSSNGQFNWVTNQNDVGSHVVTFAAGNGSGSNITRTQTFTIRLASAVAVKNLYPGSSVTSGNAISFIAVAQGYINPSFSISDSFPSSTVGSSNINSDGNFGWTPTSEDVGVHNLTIRVTSSTGRTDTIFQTVTVNGIAIQNISSTNITIGTPLTFSIATYGWASPLTYQVNDSLRNNTIDSIAKSGNSFSWTPSARDVGTHYITVTATDANNKTSEVTRKVVVSGPPIVVAPVVSPVVAPPSAVIPPAIVAPSAKFNFTKTLQNGSKGTEVTELQKKLSTLGYLSASANGIFGPATKAAVIKFQKAKKISATGMVGPATRAALNK